MKKTKPNPKVQPQNLKIWELYLTHTLIADEKDWKHIRKLIIEETKKAGN
jgi:hypothetical protein